MVYCVMFSFGFKRQYQNLFFTIKIQQEQFEGERLKTVDELFSLCKEDSKILNRKTQV